MLKLEEKVKRELLYYFPTDLHLYTESNETIKALKIEMDQLGKQLLAAAKAGLLADFFEKEAPGIRRKLEAKRQVLEEVLDIERKKRQPKTQPSAFHLKKSMSPAAGGKKVLVLEKTGLFPEFNIYMAIAVGLVFFCYQFIYNTVLENRIRTNIEQSLVRPAEERAKLAELQNVELIWKNDLLHRQVQYLNQARRVPIKPAVKPKAIKLAYNKPSVKKTNSTRYSRN